MKTKRFLALFLSAMMVLGMMPMTVFADDNPHASHSSCVYHVEAVDGNCTTPGNIEFWYCDYYTCEKCYSDEAMTVEISPADTIITPRVHSDACVNCGHTIATETFELFVPAEQPDYDEEDYFNYGFHTSFSDRLKGFKVLFVGEGSDGKLYAMSNVTNADGSRQAVELSSYLSEDGSVTVDSDTVEFFTYKVYADQETYTFSPDNGYMSAVDGKIVVRGQNIEDFRVGDINDPNDDIYEAFPPAIRFEQDNGKDDYDSTSGEGYLFSWSLDSGMIFFDPDEPAFVVTNWSSGEYTHSIMLYVERCEHENLIHTEGAELSCTQDGAIENWYCEDCQLYFADADASEYIELPENEDNYEDYLYTKTWGHSYGENCICENCGETCPHTNAFYEELENIEASCFEPGMSGYWYCEDCWYYLDENQENEYWESLPAAKIPATGHYFNTDTGVCDECGLANPVYTKVTSLDDINEEDLYIIVAEADGQYFVLGGLYDRHPDEQGNIWCPDGATNAIRVTANADGSISLVNQEVLDDGSPSEFMLDVNPEQFGDMSWLGLTTVMLKLPNHCVYPFQSYSYDNNGYMGVSRYATEYGMWDSSEWIIDFYTTVVTDDTYRYEDEFGSKTHAEQVADGNIDDNISEGNLLLYKASFYSVGGAMFTLRLREYNGQYYFICGEDWCLEGSDGWDYVTDTTPTNDIQYAVSLYRYDVPTVDAHTCEFINWTDNNDDTHTGTCECGKTETESHGWDNGVETKAPTCTEEGIKTYTCGDCGATKTEPIPKLDHTWDTGVETKAPTCTEDGVKTFTCTETNCGATKTEPIPALDHDFGEWTYDSVDSHIRYCKRENCDAEDYGGHEWGDWVPVDETIHKMVCDICAGEQTDEHDFDNGVVTKEPTEGEDGVRTYTCGTCSYTKTEPIDKLVHECTWTDWYPNGDENHKRDCMDDNCDKFETLPHEWDNGEITKEPTCTETGVRTYTCQTCMHTRTEEIPAADHTWSDWVSDGRAYHEKTCSVCFSVCREEHNWDKGAVTKEATVTENGTIKYTCADCGAARTEVIPKIECDHTWDKWTPDNDETHTHVCINGNGCAVFQQQRHEWNKGEVTLAPTETSEGVMTYMCLICSHEKRESIPMLAHTHAFGEWVSDGDGTHTRRCENGDCTALETASHICEAWADNGNGTHTGKCTVCGAEIVEEHIWSDWSVGVTEDLFIRSCICGAADEMTVQKPISNSLTNNTVSENNAANAELVIENVVDLFNDVLTNDEQKAVAEGKTTVSIYLEVEDIPIADVSASDKAAADEVIEEDAEIGMYLDIALFKEVTENNTTEEIQITETSDKVTITIQIPDDLINGNASVKRIYRIIRVHEDAFGNIATDVIEGVFDPVSKTFTFETDKFSTYALAYSDTEKLGASIVGEVTSHNAANPVTVNLVSGDEIKYTATLAAEEAIGAVTQQFRFTDVVPGTYDLVVTKPGHLPHTITGVAVSNEDIDLREHDNSDIAAIVLLAGDVNGDGCIDLSDVVLLTSSTTYGQTFKNATNKSADINGDKCFDLQDLAIVTSEKNYGKAKVEIAY